jgi:hypothetical protein
VWGCFSNDRTVAGLAMAFTYPTKNEFLTAVASELQPSSASAEIHSALLSGISSADDALRSEESDKSQAFHLKVGAWIIGEGDIPLLQALNTTAGTTAVLMKAQGLAWPVIASVLSSLADVCWRAWRKGGRLSPQQVSVYGCLQALGPLTREALSVHLQRKGEDLSPDKVTSTLESLTEIELNDGQIIALASKDVDQLWKALKI